MRRCGAHNDEKVYWQCNLLATQKLYSVLNLVFKSLRTCDQY